MSKLQPFHLAIPVSNLEKNRVFYRDTLGCKEGRSSDQWVDFDFFGHQLVLHEQQSQPSPAIKGNPVDGKEVPIPHFGVVLEWEVFQEFAEDLREKSIEFVIEPYIRFQGKTGEQATMFFRDPSGNALEFKAFKNIDQLFAK
jgi:hypothetical protein